MRVLKNIVTVVIAFILIGCSSDDSGDNNQQGNVPNVMTITLKRLNFDRATIEWTRPSNASSGTVLYEIVLNNQVVRENYQNTEYQFFPLQPQTNYNVIVTGLDSEGKETFDQISFTTLEDTRPPAQTYYGSITTSNQSFIDTFPYKNVTGSITIQGAGITDLSGLSVLEHVSAGVRIRDTSLENLDGLENLTSYDIANGGGGSLYLADNDLLTDISGANNYMAVGRNLDLRGNALLTNITGVTLNPTLRRITIREAPIENLNFLSGVTEVTEDFQLYLLPNLSDASGLSNMVFSGTQYIMVDIPQLTNLHGSFAPVLPETNVSFANMDQLTDLNCLTGATELSRLSMLRLPALSDLSGVGSVERVLDLRFIELQLTHLDDFSNITNSPNNWPIRFYANDNPNLTDYCGLTTFMQNTTTNYFSMFGNAYNPNQSQIESPTECSQ